MVVVDNNVLSSLSKIDCLELLNELFDHVSTPPSVIEELHRGTVSSSDFVARIDDVKSYNDGWLQVDSLSGEELKLAEDILDNSLSMTDAECIAVAKTRGKRLLTDDGHVGEIASQREVAVWDLKVFLEACIYKDLIETEEHLQKLIERLESEDNYRFSEQDYHDLLGRFQ
jgi:predicted nucleic acid-binding protein